MSDPVVAVRALFEALLNGCAVVAETDEAAAAELLTGLGVCLSGQVPAFRRALRAESGDAVAAGVEPFAVVPLRGGTLQMYWPGAAR